MPSETIAVAITDSARTPGTRKSTGSEKFGRDRVDLGEEHEDAERDRERDDHVLAPPHLQQCSLGARLRGDRRRELTRSLPSLGFGGDLEEHLFERATAGLQCGERDVAVAEEAREVGDARRRAGRMRSTYSPGRSSETPSTPSAERGRERRAGRGRAPAANQISSAAACARQLGRRAERGQAAAGDDRDAVAELLGLVHAVRREQHGGAACREVAHELPRGRARVRVHARGRLVEEHDLGLADQRARERQPLRLTAREPPHRRARGVAQARPSSSSDSGDSGSS